MASSKQPLETGTAESDVARQVALQASLAAVLGPEGEGLQCRWLRSLPSTNTLAAELVREAGTALLALLVADEQTHGRGRMGRQWLSRPGASLTFSLAIPLAARDWSGLSLAVGVAIVESLSAQASVALTHAPTSAAASATPSAGPTRPAIDASSAGRSRMALMLKWPNDLWLTRAGRAEDTTPGAHGQHGMGDADPSGGRKLGGILIEGIASPAAGRVAVIGIGLNLLPMPGVTLDSGHANLSELLADGVRSQSSGDPATPQAEAVLMRVVPAVLRAVRLFESGGFAMFAARYRQHDLLANQRVRASGHGVEATGIARGVDERGALLLETHDGVRAIFSGEVVGDLGKDMHTADRGDGAPVEADSGRPGSDVDDAVPLELGGRVSVRLEPTVDPRES